MEKFTQGEWAAQCPNERSYYEDTDITTYRVMAEGRAVTGDVYISIYEMSLEEARANAHLIAAAPAMYRMLKDLAQLGDPPYGATAGWMDDNMADIAAMLETVDNPQLAEEEWI